MAFLSAGSIFHAAMGVKASPSRCVMPSDSSSSFNKAEDSFLPSAPSIRRAVAVPSHTPHGLVAQARILHCMKTSVVPANLNFFMEIRSMCVIPQGTSSSRVSNTTDWQYLNKGIRASVELRPCSVGAARQSEIVIRFWDVVEGMILLCRWF